MGLHGPYPINDINVMTKVGFVMKAGVVYRQ